MTSSLQTGMLVLHQETVMVICACLQAEACKTGTLYVVNIISAQGNVLSEVAFNSQTGCLGANTVKVWPYTDHTQTYMQRSSGHVQLPS